MWDRTADRVRQFDEALILDDARTVFRRDPEIRLPDGAAVDPEEHASLRADADVTLQLFGVGCVVKQTDRNPRAQLH
jgi:hypothetical protein